MLDGGIVAKLVRLIPVSEATRTIVRNFPCANKDHTFGLKVNLTLLPIILLTLWLKNIYHMHAALNHRGYEPKTEDGDYKIIITN